MPPLDLAMDAGDSLSATNGSQFSWRDDDKSGAADCVVGKHHYYPGW